MDLVLRLPELEDEHEVLAAQRATAPDYPSFLHYYREGMPFADYVALLRDQAAGVNLPSPVHVPTTFLFAFVHGRIVGRSSIRHRLNERLERMGGHIGYAVVLEFRRRGYATAILASSIQVARTRLELGRILVTCDDDNVASIRTIERNGGVLEDIVQGPDLPKPKRRYWIER